MAAVVGGAGRQRGSVVSTPNSEQRAWSVTRRNCGARRFAHNAERPPADEALVNAAGADRCRHIVALATMPELAADFTDPRTCRSALRALLGASHQGVVARDAGQVVGCCVATSTAQRHAPARRLCGRSGPLILRLASRYGKAASRTSIDRDALIGGDAVPVHTPIYVPPQRR